MKRSRSWYVAVICCASFTVPAQPAQQESELSNSYVNSQLPWHSVALDSERKLVSWYRADENLGFDKVVHLAWDFSRAQSQNRSWNRTKDISHQLNLRSKKRARFELAKQPRQHFWTVCRLGGRLVSVFGRSGSHRRGPLHARLPA